MYQFRHMPRICCMLFMSMHVVINLHAKINTKLEIMAVCGEERNRIEHWLLQLFI